MASSASFWLRYCSDVSPELDLGSQELIIVAVQKSVDHLMKTTAML